MFISVFSGLTFIIIVSIKERGKTNRIKLLKEIDSSKIEAIGNYEKKSKSKCYFTPFWKKLNSA